MPDSAQNINSAQHNTTDIGHVVGAVFGLVFVIANTGSLDELVRTVATVAACLAFAFVVIAFIAAIRSGVRASTEHGERLERRYLLIVAVETVVLFGGLAILRPIEPAVTLGWIALVVGLHFIPFVSLWPRGRAQFYVLAATLTMLGVLGLVFAFTTHDAQLVALVSGGGSGVALLTLGVVSAIGTVRQVVAGPPAATRG